MLGRSGVIIRPIIITHCTNLNIYFLHGAAGAKVMLLLVMLQYQVMT